MAHMLNRSTVPNLERAPGREADACSLSPDFGHDGIDYLESEAGPVLDAAAV